MPRLLRPLVLLFLFAACHLEAPAQSLPPRIRTRIAGAARRALPATREPRAVPESDEGALPGNQRIEGMALVFQHSAAQQADLDQLLAAQQDVHSPLYHQWLTPDTFAARFGMAEADLQQASTWLQSFGFSVAPIPASRDRLVFSGTAAEVATAFGTELHHYTVNGEQHFAPAAALTLPAPLAEVTLGVLHLNDFKPKPQHATALQPSYTTGTSQAHFLVPSDMPVLYDAEAAPGSTAVAVVGESYVDTFSGAQNSFGQLNLTAVLVPDTGIEAVYPGVQFEAQLDIEYAGAGNTTVLYLYTGDRPNYGAFEALDFAITSNVASVISVSFGECETLLSAAAMDQYNALLMQAAAQGQTVIGSSGDLGSTSCITQAVTSSFTATQQQALAVGFPSNSPFVLAVGGTQMQDGAYAAGSSNYWAATNTSDQHSLLSYVPETTWNEGVSAAYPLAGGGGASTHFARPAWQANVSGIPSGSTRLVPDIALQASVHSPGFVVCTNDPGVGQPGGSATCPSGLNGTTATFAVGGGTSFGAPIMAGFVARLNTATGNPRQGNLGPALYRLAGQPGNLGTVFHDIATGSIACVAGATNCTAAGMAGYAATAGYDQATGLGSIDLARLIAAWPSTTQPGSRTASYLSVTAPHYAQPSGTISGTIFLNNGGTSGGNPMGTVAVAVDGTVVQPALPLSTNSTTSTAQFSLTLPSTIGSHLVSVSYAGDATHLPTSGFVSIDTGTLQASGSVSLSAPAFAVPSNATATTPVLATPAGGYHGTLLWKLAATSSYTATVCYKILPLIVPSTGATSATLKIGSGTACSSAAAFGSVQSGPTRLAEVNGRNAGSPAQQHPQWPLLAGLGPFGLVAILRRKGGRRMPTLLLLCLVAAGAGLGGCGGGSTPSAGAPPSSPTPTAQTLTFTLTGTDSVNQSITAATSVTVTLN